MENITGSLVVIGLITLAIIFMVYMILSSRINSNLNKLDQKIQDLRYERQESVLNISQRMRAVETSLRDTERTLRYATDTKTSSESTKAKSTKQTSISKNIPASKSGITKTSRESESPAYSRNSSDDSLSSSLVSMSMMNSHYTSPSSSESSRSESCSSSSSNDSSSSSYDSSSSSSSCSDSSSGF